VALSDRTKTILNVTLTNADTEVTLAIPANCFYFTWQCRTAFAVRFAWETGKVAGPTAPYMTLKSGAVSNSPVAEDTGAVGQNLFLASSEAAVVVEMEVWTRD